MYGAIMRKLLIITTLSLLPLSLWASKLEMDLRDVFMSPIPIEFQSSSETDVLEWGCPVSDLVKAQNQAEALEKIGQECLVEARKAAAANPSVFEVITASVVWPDVSVSKEKGGFRLQGTIFLETLVLKNAAGE